MNHTPEFPVALQVRGVTRREKRRDAPILDDIHARFHAGRLSAVVGADGAGKTTLMRIMAGILAPSAGVVEVFGEDLYAQVSRLQAHIGYMPQQFGLYEDLSVAENFALYAELFGLSDKERSERTRELLAMTGLSPFTERLAGKLSGGMKQKLGLACALLNHPRVLLLDEPTVGVDPLSRRELWRILRHNVLHENMCVVVATTYMDEASLCDDVLIVEDGKVWAEGSPESIARQAQGRTYLARSSAQHARLLQAQLWDADDCVSDAVPEADGVRVLLRQGASIEALRERFAEVQFAARASLLEDGYLCARERIMGPPSRQIDRFWLVHHAHGNAQKPVIAAHKLTRHFGSFVAVESTTFDVRPGEIFGLLGPNGAGKTTTFKMLCGLLEVTSGELTVAGVDVRKQREQARAHMGYMSQKFALYGELTVQENLEFFAAGYGLKRAQRAERIAQIVRAFGLEGLQQRAAGKLSGGYKQRLAMAAALMHHPRILFLDEPTSGADIATRRQFWRTMTALAETGTTIVVTTHFMQEALYCDRILIQDAGKCLVLGTPQAVRGTNASMDAAFIDIVERARQEAA